jgi:hypothetical protein
MTTTVTFTETTPVAGDTIEVILQKHALAWANAEGIVADYEALLTEAKTLRAERHHDLLVTIAELAEAKVSNNAIAKTIKATGVAFSNDLVGHARRAYGVAQHDEADDVAELAYNLRCAITNACTNRSVKIGQVDEALKGVTSTAKAVAIVDGLLKAEPVDETDGEGDGDGDGEGEGGKGKGKTDADRLTAIANTIKGMKRDGTATPEAVAEIVTALTALVAA